MATKNVDDEEEKKETKIKKPEVKVEALTDQQKLYWFCYKANIEGIKEVKGTIDINATDTEGFRADQFIEQNCALHYAVQSQSLECVKTVYALEATLDVTNKFKSTPLHIAASLGLAEIVGFLIQMKATIDPKNLIQNTPLHCAVYAGHVDAVKVILDNIDEPRQALLEPNGVGMGPAKYTAHDEMKALLRQYFPPIKDKKEKPQSYDEPPQEADIQEEAPPGYDEANNNDIQEEAPQISNPEPIDDDDGDDGDGGEGGDGDGDGYAPGGGEGGNDNDGNNETDNQTNDQTNDEQTNY